MKEIYPESLNDTWLRTMLILPSHDACIQMTKSVNDVPEFSLNNILSATAFRGTVCSPPQVAKFGLVYDRTDNTVRESAAVNNIRFRMKCTEKMVYISNGLSIDNRDRKREECNRKLSIASSCLTEVPYVCEGDEVIVLSFKTKQGFTFCTILNVTGLEYEPPTA